MSRSPLVGTWALRRFELRFPDGSVTHPYGEEVVGLLMYDTTGHMSAAFGSASRHTGESSDLAEVGAKVSYDSFMSYCGLYEVKENRIAHRVEISSLEAWTGTLQERRFEIKDDQLTLDTMPLAVGSDSPTGRLVWHRVRVSEEAP